MTVAAAEEELRGAIRARLEVAAEAYSEETRASADYLVDLAIERLIMAALLVGRPRPTEAQGHA